MKTVQVNLGERSYAIRVGNTPGFSVDGMFRGRTCLMVSDTTVDAVLGDRGQQLLESAGARVIRATVPAGESSKSLACAEQLYHDALAAGLDRSSVIAALGGGMVGDLAGFVAATFLRGVRFVQVPTTLLAMVDSSVGGKTGVNLPEGKNLVGAFYQPQEVVADLSALESLPLREYCSGLAEVVKYGVIWDRGLFELLESNVEQLLGRDADLLEAVVSRCCEIKAEVVSRDERDSGLRAILNYGHTLGHAIEQVFEYGTYLHGEAIAIGMHFAGGVSRRISGFASADAERVTALLSALKLPVRFREGAPEWKALCEAMACDKKTEQGIPRFVLAEQLGRVKYGCEVPVDVLAGAYEDLTA